ncbi:MAG: HlyD family efflux transporter periplasmic adaptor subunit [Candidatus Promineifilaceae bacterium]
MKKLYLLIICLFLSACGLGTDGQERRVGDLGEPTPIPTSVTAARPTYKVERGTVVFAIDFPGRVVPVVEQNLTFSRNGAVGEVFVKVGDEVEAGQPIATLDTSNLEGELALAQSALSVAEGQLAASQAVIEEERQTAEIERDLAQLDLDYATQQAGDNPTADQQYQIERLTLLLSLAQLKVDSLDTAFDPELQANVDAATQRVAELESLIAGAVLEAPFDGVIASLTVSTGRAITVDDVIGVIADPAEIEVSSNLQDSQMEQLAEGMTAEIVPAGGPGDSLSGTIRHLPFPYGSSGGGILEGQDRSTRVQFDDMVDGFGSYETGNRVRVNVVVTEKDDVLWLPPAAVRDFNGRKFVVVQTDGVEQRVDVELGIEGDGRVEILSGLEEGQTVVGQ